MRKVILKELSNEQLVQLYKDTNNEIYFSALLENNAGLINKFVKKYVQNDCLIYTFEDITSVIHMAIYQCIPKYDESQCKFITYMYGGIRNHMATYMRKTVRNNSNPKYIKYNSVSIHGKDPDNYKNGFADIVKYESNVFDSAEDVVLANDLLSAIESKASPKQMEIIRLKLQGFTTSQIARRLECSPQAIDINIRRFKQKLSNIY